MHSESRFADEVGGLPPKPLLEVQRLLRAARVVVSTLSKPLI